MRAGVYVGGSEVYGHVADGPLAGVVVCGCLGNQMAAMMGEGGCVGGGSEIF